MTSNKNDRIWNFFASVKLSVILLLALAFTSIIGTLIPQNKNPAQYLQQYGEFRHSIFEALSFYNMYSSWWFRLLLAMLIMNIIICSIERLRHTWKVIFPGKKTVYRASRFAKSDRRRSHTTTQAPEKIRPALMDYMEKHFRRCHVESTATGYLIYGEKGRWTRLGAYIIHLSVLSLTLGVLISSLFGYEGRVNIPVGETVDAMTLRHSDTRVQLDFALRCDDFSMKHYPSGSVKEYRSELAIIENGKVVDKRSLIVNAPIRYRGYNIFQSTYGRIPGENVTLVFTDNDSGLQTKQKASIGEKIPLPGGKGNIIVQEYTDDFEIRGRKIGPTYLSLLVPESGPPRPLALPLGFPRFDRMRQGEFTISVENVDHRYFTGLQISRDPGIPVVFTSFAVMIFGFLVTFYLAHRQVCVEAVRNGETTINISGVSPNRRPGVDMTVKKVSGKIKRIIEKENKNT